MIQNVRDRADAKNEITANRTRYKHDFFQVRKSHQGRRFEETGLRKLADGGLFETPGEQGM
jgi:hypothetical protein